MTWDKYIASLTSNHNHNKDSKDELNWLNDLVGVCHIPKLGYRVLCEDEALGNLEWWFKIVWKFKFPLLSRISIWLVLKNLRLLLGVVYKRGEDMDLVCILFEKKLRSLFCIHLYYVLELNLTSL